MSIGPSGPVGYGRPLRGGETSKAYNHTTNIPVVWWKVPWSLSVMINWVIRVNPTQPVGQGLPSLTMTVVQQGQVQQGQWHVNPTQPVGQGLPTLTNDSSPARTSPARTVARVVLQGQQYTSNTATLVRALTCYRSTLEAGLLSFSMDFRWL